MKHVFVTGATGFVGSHLCRELTEKGYKVTASHRPSSDISYLKKLNVHLLKGDITDLEFLIEATSGVDGIIHLAALYRSAKFPDSEYWKINNQGTKNVVFAAQKNNVRRFVHCSTIGVHSHIENPPADETEPYAPTDVYQESKVAAEKFVLEEFQAGRLNGAVIRPAMIWGAHDRRFLKLFRGIYRRRMPLIGDGSNLCHWIWVNDLARAFRLALEDHAHNGEVYIIAGERPVTLRYTMETIADVYKKKLLPFHIPALPIQIAGSIVEAICRPLGIEPPLHRRRADFFIKNRAFRCDKATQQLKFHPTYRFEEEATIVANWYRSSGWL